MRVRWQHYPADGLYLWVPRRVRRPLWTDRLDCIRDGRCWGIEYRQLLITWGDRT